MATNLTEIMLSRAWHEGLLAPELRLVDGHLLKVVYRGRWTHSDGPDFADAMLEIDGELRRGFVELHHRSSDWNRHRHNLNPLYDDVILHAVFIDDLDAEVAGPSAKPIPTLELRSFLQVQIDELVAGGLPFLPDLPMQAPCLPTLANEQPDLVRAAIRSKGWERLVDKQLRFSQALSIMPAGEALYRGLLDSLGFSRNRDAMATLGESLPLAMLEDFIRIYPVGGAHAALLGAGGFLPLSDSNRELSGLGPRLAEVVQGIFESLARTFELTPLALDSWTLNRVRPANHPVRRLASLARLVEKAQESGLFGTWLALHTDDGAAWSTWLESARPTIGKDRRNQILTNVFAPFLAAYADVTGNDALAETTGQLWEQLPGAVSDAVARRTRRQIVGQRRFPIRLAIEEQGLHQIGRLGCSDLRCFECPIAALAMSWENQLQD